MKKIILSLMFFVGALLASPLTPFDCSLELSDVWFTSPNGVYANQGAYTTVCANYPSYKTQIDESIVLKVQTIMTNEVAKAKVLATSATNHSITIPQGTWDYLNSH